MLKMTEADAIAIFERNGAIKTGHYVYLGGDHGKQYIDKKLVLENIGEADYLCLALAVKLTEAGIDPEIIIGPQTGGALMAPRVAYHLSQTLKHEVLRLCAEKNGKNFKISPQAIKAMLDKRIVIVDDVFQRGTSVGRMIKALNEVKGTIVGIGVLWNRSGNALVTYKNIEFVNLINLQLTAWSPPTEPCPLCIAGTPISTDLGHGKEFLEDNKDKLCACPACGGIADWIDKVAGFFCCRKCHAVPAGLEFD